MLRPNRRRAPLLLVLLSVVALLGTACNQNNTPSSYDSVTQQNFIAGCTGNTSDGATGNTGNAGNGPSTTLAPQSACECAYNWIVLNVPYNDTNKKTPTTIEGIGSQTFTPDYSGDTFQKINDNLADNPDQLPPEIQQGLADNCKSAGWKPATTSTSATEGGGPTTVPQ